MGVFFSPGLAWDTRKVTGLVLELARNKSRLRQAISATMFNHLASFQSAVICAKYARTAWSFTLAAVFGCRVSQ